MKTNYAVIPALAGTQQCKCSAKRTKTIVDPLLGNSFNHLDSRLRGNDEVVA
jgi:hypothetical protein